MFLKQYVQNDLKRLWRISNFFYVPYQQFEYTRLSKVRKLMDSHMSYDKEELLQKDEKDENNKFVWSYVLRPVKKGYKWLINLRTT